MKKNTVLLAFSIFLFFGGFSLWKFINFQKIDHYSYSQYIELLDRVQNSYPEKQDPAELIYSSIDGMIEYLDPHSNFLDPKEYKAMKQRQEGRFSGIGILIGLRNGKITVISPVEGTPAYRLGVRSGDIITEIDGEPTEDMSLNKVVEKLRGPKGSEVEVTFLRLGTNEQIKLKIKREVILETAVRYPTIMENNVGYIRVTDFNKTTADELKDALNNLKSEGINKLILDLRDNPGGILEQAKLIAGFFLKPNSMVVYTRGRDVSSVMEFKTEKNNVPFKFPLIVLVNSGSASASEIVAGALQDHDRALITGEVTFGKGLVQSVYELPQDTALALTTARYYIPSGRCIQRDYTFLTDYLKGINGKTSKIEYYTDSRRKVYGGGGVTPDIVVKTESISSTQIKLQGLGLYFNFAIEYTSKNEQISENLTITPQLLEDFVNYLLKNKFLDQQDKEKILTDEKENKITKFMLKREILSAKFGISKGYQLTLNEDEQIIEALKSFDKAEELAQKYFSN